MTSIKIPLVAFKSLGSTREARLPLNSLLEEFVLIESEEILTKVVLQAHYRL